MQQGSDYVEMTGALLDDVYSQMQAGAVAQAIDKLYAGLHLARTSIGDLEWFDLVGSSVVTHPLLELTHSDPITRRAFEKPRGYAGDAVLMDMIYGIERAGLAEASPIGKTIFDYNWANDAAAAVRMRRSIIARTIDEICEQRQRSAFLSLACGHLREADLSSAIQCRKFDRFLALDHDQESLTVVERDYAKYGVKTLKKSVRELLRDRQFEGGFDLIYSSGLYDYLEKKVATKLTYRLFKLLAPGGHLLLTNFLPSIRSVGYMESFMDWKLIYRSEAELVDLAASVPRREIDRTQVFSELQENIVFLKLHKRL